jgi:hypothetical protein
VISGISDQRSGNNDVSGAGMIPKGNQRTPTRKTGVWAPGSTEEFLFFENPREERFVTETRAIGQSSYLHGFRSERQNDFFAGAFSLEASSIKLAVS